MDIVCGDINKILDVVSKEFFFSVNISNGQLKDKDIVKPGQKQPEKEAAQ